MSIFETRNMRQSQVICRSGMALATMLAVPSLVAADPIGIDPIGASLPLALESLFFALTLRAFGFRPLVLLIGWFLVTFATWFLLVGLPLGPFVAMLAGSAISGEEGNLIYLAAAIGIEMVVCLIEALILLLAGRISLLRRPESASLPPSFAKLFKIAILGNLVSVVAGLPEMLESKAAWLCYLAIFPAIFLAGKITGPASTTTEPAIEKSSGASNTKAH